jgi:hypothetical protein
MEDRPRLTRRLFGSFLLVAVLATLTMTGSRTSGAQRVLRVPAQFKSIQAAIVAAHENDVVRVDAGTYRERINFLGKAITVHGLRGRESTVLIGDGKGPVVTFNTRETRRSVLSGFTITGGLGAGYVSHMTLGGGIFCNGASPVIKNNWIMNNSATFGAGIYCSYDANALISENIVSDNGGEHGGGINCFMSAPDIEGNVVIRNMAITGSGGGIYCYQCSPRIVNNVIALNHAYGKGGGIHIDFGGAPTVLNCTVAENTAQDGGGVYCDYASRSSIVNSILWDNAAVRSPEIGVQVGVSSNVTYSNVRGGWKGLGNIAAHPVFAKVIPEDFMLCWSSPCIDAGAHSSTTLPETDIHGDPRIVNGRVDIGADEFCSHLAHLGRAETGGKSILKVCGKPGAGVLLFLGAGTLVSPVSLPGIGDLYLLPPIQLIWTGYVGPAGHVKLTLIYASSMPAPLYLPFQALIDGRLSNIVVVTVHRG